MRIWKPIVGIGAAAALAFSLHSNPNAVQAQQAAIVPASAVMTEFRSGSVDFDETRGTEASKTVTINFQGREVLSAEVMLKGFDLIYVGAEHPVHQEKVKFDNIQLQGESVKFDTHLLIRDNSGNIDDPYRGTVEFVVIARTR